MNERTQAKKIIDQRRFPEKEGRVLRDAKDRHGNTFDLLVDEEPRYTPDELLDRLLARHATQFKKMAEM